MATHEIHAVVDERGFHGPSALLAPADDSHFLDGEVFGVGDGGVFSDQRFVMRGKGGLAFVAEADGSAGKGGRQATGGEGGGRGRREAVTDGSVGGGASLAFGRNRPLGLFGVGSVGGEAAGG